MVLVNFPLHTKNIFQQLLVNCFKILPCKHRLFTKSNMIFKNLKKKNTFEFKNNVLYRNNEINLDAQFLKTLSQILRHMSSVSMQHVSMISQFSVNFIKKFPESTDNFIHELPALKKTFSNMSQLSKNYQDEYFNLFCE